MPDGLVELVCPSCGRYLGKYLEGSAGVLPCPRSPRHPALYVSFAVGADGVQAAATPRRVLR